MTRLGVNDPNRMRYLNHGLTAILILAIAYAMLRGFQAEVDGAASARARQAERERDSVAREAYRWRTEAEGYERRADSLAALVDSAKVVLPPMAEVREAKVKALKYAPLNAVIDTLAKE